MVSGVPNGQVSLGASLRDRATLPSPLRGLGPSGGYPSRLRSLRSLRAPLARRLAALAAVAGPARPVLHSTAPSTAPPCPPRDGAARRARRGARLVALAGCAGCGPRLAAAAPRAPPVSASPSTGSRTARCSRVRTSADTTAIASGSVLRTTACGSVRTAARSRAAAAPLRRLRRRRFPELRCCRFGRPDRRGGLGSHTRRIVDAGSRLAVPWPRLADYAPTCTARVSAPGVPELPATDRCSQPTLRYVAAGGSVAPMPRRAPFGIPKRCGEFS